MDSLCAIIEDAVSRDPRRPRLPEHPLSVTREMSPDGNLETTIAVHPLLPGSRLGAHTSCRLTHSPGGRRPEALSNRPGPTGSGGGRGVTWNRGSPRLHVLPVGETRPSPATNVAVFCSFVNFYFLKISHGQSKRVLAATKKAEAGGISHHSP